MSFSEEIGASNQIVMEGHSESVLNALKVFYTDGILTDTIFMIGRTKIVAHIPIIQCFTSYFTDCFNNETHTVYISDNAIRTDSLKLVFDYFYFGTVQVHRELDSSFQETIKLLGTNIVTSLKTGKRECTYYTDNREFILQRLWASCNSPTMCDVKIVTNNYAESYGHSCILAACSPYLLNIFLENWKDRRKPFILLIPNIKNEDLEIVLEFCYKGSVIINDENAKSVYQTAQLLGVRRLCEKLALVYPSLLEPVESGSTSCEISKVITSFGMSEESCAIRKPLQEALSILLECENLIDTSIYVENVKIGAHIVILSIFSSYFRNTITKLKDCKNNFVLLASGYKLEHIKAFIDYIYKGEAEFPGSIDDFSQFMTEWLDCGLLPVSEKLSVTTKAPPPPATVQISSAESNNPKETLLDDNYGENSLSDKTLVTENEDNLEEKDSTSETPLILEEDSGACSDYPKESVLVCYTCNETFKNRQQFKQHLKIHPDGRIMKCKYCGKGFEKPSQMKLHVRIHTGSKPFQCEVCGLRFAAKSSLTKHRNTHTKDKANMHSCDVCNKSFSRKEYVVEHLRTHTGSKPYECPECHKTFVGRTGLNHHKKVHAANDSKKSTVCEVCGKNFTRHALWTHMKSHNKIHKCELCSNLYSTKTALKNHIAGTHLGHMTHQCDICGKGFMQKNHLLRHMDTHLREDQSEEKFSCEDCEKQYKSQEKLDSHRIREHSKPGERPYSCNICNKKFSGRSTVIYHRRTHTGEQPHECSVCGKTFTRPDALRQHFRSHTNEQMFECSICNKKFSSKTILNRHILTHKVLDKDDSENTNDFLSEDCEKVFSIEKDQTTHSTLHTSSRPHRCTVCRKSFRYHDSLMKHTQIHSSPPTLKLPAANELPSLFAFHVCEQSYSQTCVDETQKKNSIHDAFCTVSELIGNNDTQELSVASAVDANSRSLAPEMKGSITPVTATRRPFSITIDGNLCCNSEVLLPAGDNIVTLVSAIPGDVSDHNTRDQTAINMTDRVDTVSTTETTNVAQVEACFPTILSKTFELQAL